MRTIKFKGKSIDSSEWTEGYYYQECDNTYIIKDRQKDSMLNRNEAVLIDPDTVCQFTGLLDKNGKEIYEGDILKVSGLGEKIEVRYVRGVFAFLWNGDLDDEAPINAPTQEWAEVVGNIHDNPKLIKRRKG